MQSRLYLPKIPNAPETILEYLIAHFPQIPAETWRERIEAGRVKVEDGAAVKPGDAYRHGITILYSREVSDEPNPVEEETVLFEDSDILVVDKPHGMVVTPAGDHVGRALLNRLQHRMGCSTLAPMHRLDRETAGVVLFTKHEETRGRYHQLFAEGRIEREYLAVAHLNATTVPKQWLVKNRMEDGEPWYRQRIAADSTQPNTITEIELVESRDGLGLFRLRPQTGKKHQLRVHMTSIGFPIVGDLLYPEIREWKENDPPLQLLAHRLSFSDPLSGEPRSFTSARKLLWP